MTTLTSFLAQWNPRRGGDVLRAVAQTLAVLLPVFLVMGRAVSEWTLSITAVLFLAHCVRRRDWIWTKEPWVRVALLLWAWQILTSLTGMDPAFSLRHAASWIRFPVFTAAMVCWIADRAWLERFAAVTGAVLAFVGLDTLFQYFAGQDVFGTTVGTDRRLTGPFDSKVPGIFMAKTVYLAAAPLLAGAVMENRKLHTAFFSAAFVVLFAAVVLAGERMAAILFLFGAVLFVLFFAPLRRLSLMLVFSIALSAGTLVLLQPQIMVRHVQQTTKTASDVTSSAYGRAWANAARLGADNPLLGIGPRNFRKACNCKEVKQCKENEVPCFLHPHNVYLEWFAETGVPGLLGFLVLIGFWFQKMLKALRMRRVSPHAVGGWITVCLGLWPLAATGSFFSNWNEALFWLALAMALAATERCVSGDLQPATETHGQEPPPAHRHRSSAA